MKFILLLIVEVLDFKMATNNKKHFLLQNCYVLDTPRCDTEAKYVRLSELANNPKDRKEEDVDYIYTLKKHEAGFEYIEKTPHAVSFDSVQDYAFCDYRNDLSSALAYSKENSRQNLGDVATLQKFTKMDTEQKIAYLKELQSKLQSSVADAKETVADVKDVKENVTGDLNNE